MRQRMCEVMSSNGGKGKISQSCCCCARIEWSTNPSQPVGIQVLTFWSRMFLFDGKKWMMLRFASRFQQIIVLRHFSLVRSRALFWGFSCFWRLLTKKAVSRSILTHTHILVHIKVMNDFFMNPKKKNSNALSQIFIDFIKRPSFVFLEPETLIALCSSSPWHSYQRSHWVGIRISPITINIFCNDRHKIIRATVLSSGFIIIYRQLTRSVRNRKVKMQQVHSRFVRAA